MSFTQVYRNILLPFVESYHTAKNEKARKHVLETAANAVLNSRNLLEEQGLDLPQDLKAAVRRYIKKGCLQKQNNPTEDAVKDSPKPTKIKGVYTVRDVIKQQHRSLVDKEIPFNPQTKEYLGCYQRAVTTVLERMDSAERRQVEKLAQSWNEQGAPREVQFKRAKTKLPKDVKKHVDEWKSGSGALAICLVAYYDGADIQAFHVESAPEVGNSFTHACPDWKDGTYELFKNWAAKQFADPRSEDEAEEGEVPVEYKKAKDISFKRKESGALILPPMNDYRKIRQKQRVVRAYAGAVYRDFTGSSTSAFPYSLSAKNDQMIFSPDCIPDGFCLSDPDHLTTAQINLLYMHWLKRQAEGLAPLIILNASPLHGVTIKKSKKAKGKAKVDWVDVRTSDDEEEEELQNGEKEDDCEEEGDDGGENEGDDDDDGENEDDEDDNGVNKGKPPVIKYGPPQGKQKKIPPSAQSNADPAAAGPSTTPPLKHISKAYKAGQASKLLPTAQSQPPSIREPASNALSVSRPSKTKSPTTLTGPVVGKELADVERPSDWSKKTNSKKREPEQDLTADILAKRVRTDGSKKVGRQAVKEPDANHPEAVGASKWPKSSKPSKSSGFSEPTKPSKLEGKKRKHVEEQELAAESSQHSKRIKKTDSSKNALQPRPLTPKAQTKGRDPVSTPEPLARVRGAGRVREFPAGNTATSSSRIAFLKSLCSLPRFRALVDLVQLVPRPSPIPRNYPSWASWESREVYLPAEFHSASAFKNALSIGHEALEECVLSEGGGIDAPLLLLGLMYREASRAMEVEPGDEAKIPGHLSQSTFGMKELNKIESILGKVHLQSSQ